MEFSYYFHYCKNLKFEDRPDYTTLKCMFADLLASRIKIENEFVFDWFDENNSNRKEVKGIDRNLNNNEMKEKSEREELSPREEENNNDNYVTPGGEEEKKNEPISLFGNTKTGNEDEDSNKKDTAYAETFLKNVGKSDDKIPQHDGEVIQLKEAENEDKESVSESNSEGTEKLEKEKEKGSKKSSDSNYGILKSSSSDKNNQDVALNVNNKDDIAIDVNK